MMKCRNLDIGYSILVIGNLSLKKAPISNNQQKRKLLHWEIRKEHIQGQRMSPPIDFEKRYSFSNRIISPKIFREITQSGFMLKGFLSVPVDRPVVVRR